MNGPIKFVFAIMWFAIAVDTIGVLRSCTVAIGKSAIHSNRHEVMSLGQWNRRLLP